MKEIRNDLEKLANWILLMCSDKLNHEVCNVWSLNSTKEHFTLVTCLAVRVPVQWDNGVLVVLDYL